MSQPTYRFPGAPQYGQAQPPRKKSRAPLIVGVAAIVVVAIALAVWLLKPPTLEEQRVDATDAAAAACQDAVKDQLKSPSTAEFSDQVITWDDTGAVIEGNVDSQNGFGAMVRSEWSCFLDIDLDNDAAITSVDVYVF